MQGTYISYAILRVFNIDVTALQYPPYKLLDIEGILENLSDLEAVCVMGVNVIALRLMGLLQGAGSVRSKSLKMILVSSEEKGLLHD
jgi:hypothetical protein